MGGCFGWLDRVFYGIEDSVFLYYIPLIFSNDFYQFFYLSFISVSNFEVTSSAIKDETWICTCLT